MPFVFIYIKIEKYNNHIFFEVFKSTTAVGFLWIIDSPVPLMVVFIKLNCYNTHSVIMYLYP